MSAAHQLVIQQEGVLLRLAAHWADLHHPDSRADMIGPGAKLRGGWGGEGTPEVLEFAAAELGAQGTTPGAGRALLADALDLRLLLPTAGAAAVDAGAGRRVRVSGQEGGPSNRHLSRDAAGQVDVAVAGLIAPSRGTDWSRCCRPSSSRPIPTGGTARSAVGGGTFVRPVPAPSTGSRLWSPGPRPGTRSGSWPRSTGSRRSSAAGLPDTADVRRSIAIGILAQPAEAVEVFCTHQNNHRPRRTRPHPDDPAASSDEQNRSLIGSSTEIPRLAGPGHGVGRTCI